MTIESQLLRRRIIILHGLSADSRSDWYAGVAEHYRALGHSVLVPNLPGTYAPNLNRCVRSMHALLMEQQWDVDERLTLIGHCTGCMAALRFVESLPDGVRVGPSVMVAAFPAALGHPNLPVLVARSPRPDRIRPKLTRLLAVHSTNDWRVPIHPNAQWMVDHLGAELHTVANAGHFINRHGWTDWDESLYARVEEFWGAEGGRIN